MAEIKKPIGAFVNEGASCTSCGGTGAISDTLSDGSRTVMACWHCNGSGKDSVVVYEAPDADSKQ